VIKLNKFDGGLNTRVGKHLLALNEATACENVDLFSQSLRSVKAPKALGISLKSNIYHYKGSWLSSDEDRDYQEFQGKLYYSSSDSYVQKTSDGSQWYDLGIKKPRQLAMPGASYPGNKLGLYYYSYTYYNSSDGEESASADYTEWNGLSTKPGSYARVELKTSTDVQVTHIRLYRMGGDLLNMTLVATLSNSAQTYIDELADIDIAGNHQLDTQNTRKAPYGLRFLTETGGMFFGALNLEAAGAVAQDLNNLDYGYRLWFSAVGNLGAWSNFNYIVFNSAITGLAPVQNGLLVFTKFKTYIVTGASPATMSRFLLDDAQGCLSHKTISYIDNQAIWLSSDGLCTTTGGAVKVLSRDKLGKLNLTGIKDAIVFDGVYYICYADEILVADLRSGLRFSTLAISADSFHSFDDVLYYSANGYLYEMQAGSYAELTYRTGYITTEYSYFKLYDNMRLSYSGDFNVGIFTGDKGYTYDISSVSRTVTEIKGFNNTIADGLEFQIKGKGTIYEISFNTYDRYSIMQSTKFFDTIMFRASVLVNKAPTIFNHIEPETYLGDLVPLEMTNSKLFKLLYFTYRGSVTITVYIDQHSVVYELQSEMIATAELKLPSTIKRGYQLRFKYVLGIDSKLFAIDVPSEVRQNVR